MRVQQKKTLKSHAHQRIETRGLYKVFIILWKASFFPPLFPAYYHHHCQHPPLPAPPPAPIELLYPGDWNPEFCGQAECRLDKVLHLKGNCLQMWAGLVWPRHALWIRLGYIGSDSRLLCTDETHSVFWKTETLAVCHVQPMLRVETPCLYFFSFKFFFFRSSPLLFFSYPEP